MAHTTGCQTCDTLLNSSEQGRIIFDATSNLLQMDEKQIENFLKAVNALLNEGSGVVIFHAENPHLLSFFDHKVDDKLKKLIPDESFFHDNFDRFFNDRKHIVFRVKSRIRPVSTLSFNTKVSLNKGRDEPTHFQMKMLFWMSSGPEPKPASAPDQLVVKSSFVYEQEVEVLKGVFQESVAVQAKSIPKKIWDNGGGERNVKQLVDHCWTQVPSYITAFSKLPSGGSMYLGVSEEKTEEKNWDRLPTGEVPEEVNKWVQTQGRGMVLWKDKKKDMLHIAKEDDVPCNKQKNTGKFICKGLRLSKTQQKELRDQLLDRVFREMLWLAPFPEKPVEVKFHNVAKAPTNDYYVVEITTTHLHGIVFYEKEGPAAYIRPESLQTNASPRIDMMEVSKWVRLNEGTISRHTPSRPMPADQASGPSPSKKKKT